MPYLWIRAEMTSGKCDERPLDFTQGCRVEVHVNDGLLDQLTSDPEPLLSRCWPWPVIKAIKDRAFWINAVKDVCHLLVATISGSGQPNPVTSVKRTRFSGDSKKSSNSTSRALPLASRFGSWRDPQHQVIAPERCCKGLYVLHISGGCHIPILEFQRGRELLSNGGINNATWAITKKSNSQALGGVRKASNDFVPDTYDHAKNIIYKIYHNLKLLN